MRTGKLNVVLNYTFARAVNHKKELDSGEEVQQTKLFLPLWTCVPSSCMLSYLKVHCVTFYIILLVTKCSQWGVFLLFLHHIIVKQKM